MAERLLTVEQLQVSFHTRDGDNQAVRGVSLHIDAGETLGIVGESGSGKSVTAKAIMALIEPPGEIISGRIEYRGKQLTELTEKEWRKLRGNEIAMVFQDPMTAMNPVKRIGSQMMEILRRHRNLSKEEAKRESIELLRQVGITEPERRLNQYPHEFSGGMRQRVMIAMALSCKPGLLIADEPTTALDVTIQAQILDLLKELKNNSDTAIALITHDLGVVAQVCTRVIVMYGGMMMESGSVEDIFYRSQHPYTQGLLRSVPKRGGERERLVPIEGTPPDLLNPPPGCPFMARCPHAMSKCASLPPVYTLSQGHTSMCWLADKEAKTQ
ncbi:oligopeptide/dipeptide ABC transporter ATP-binding protein [Paenibacillus cellulosilyticus]|uniref:Oligopeptide/dipeptide ABC transporter ATP-binding protein n=1 Tax=Paenibacillus cellulosilyticus TaxID=375489 RepID=A0A2V2YQY9_9BACL|nr:ABC transporter ATP-binding protein [Paenibacillus cellulosilyticus]PWV98453.1 oligopeptide/dipeptide ABC transporter ATP-binding protein [Paenibacillus cellulosilyticus]QKS43297.1 ABC transporter ATP-binding protein [Paenibacillus cellulosilyticus]